MDQQRIDQQIAMDDEVLHHLRLLRELQQQSMGTILAIQQLLPILANNLQTSLGHAQQLQNRFGTRLAVSSRIAEMQEQKRPAISPIATEDTTAPAPTRGSTRKSRSGKRRRPARQRVRGSKGSTRRAAKAARLKVKSPRRLSSGVVMDKHSAKKPLPTLTINRDEFFKSNSPKRLMDIRTKSQAEEIRKVEEAMEIVNKNKG